jgi:hypothetical protein
VPLFYFDVSAGDGSARYYEDLELDSLKAAEDRAIFAAAEIGHDRWPKGRTSEVCLRVKDEDGFLLLTVDIPSMTVRRTVRALVLEDYPRVFSESRPRDYA